jgi:hypothetical protein
VGRAIAGSLTLLMMAGLYVQLEVWMGNWRAAIEHPWPERVALGSYLRTLPGTPTVYCDDATLEILSGLDRRRFDRHWVDDPETWRLVHDRAAREGEVYVATWRRKLQGHEGAGDVLFTAGIDPAEPASTGVAVVRVRR